MLTDVVYSDLREKILNLSLKPGTTLSFSNLTPLYNVSVSPVRDALKRLATEGLVEIKPQSGTSVSLIDLDKVRDERFIRLFLELGAIEQSGRNGFSPAIKTGWEDSLALQHESFACRDIAKFLQLDDMMHRLLFESCQHQHVFDTLKSNSGNYHRIRMVSYLFDDILQNILVQHQQILEAILADDVPRVLQLDRTHISKIEVETSNYQKAYPQYFKKN